MRSSIIEFYCDDNLLVQVESSMVLPVGGLISIKMITYKVVKVTFAVDHSADILSRRLRCNVDLEKVK